MSYFTFEELVKSDTAKRLGIDNTPTDENVIENIHKLISVMDIIREEWTIYCKERGLQHPQIIVNSGYRCKALNEAVKGSSTSSHMYGTAIDFRAKNWDNKALWGIVIDTLKKYEIPFNQLIDENRLLWIHLDIMNSRGEQRGEILFK